MHRTDLKEKQLIVGTTSVDLDLGSHTLWIDVRKPVGDEIRLCDAFIDLNLSLDFQTSTESSSLNALDSPTQTPVPSPVPQGNRKVKFTVESVTYTGTGNVIVTPADIHVDPELTTDPNGNCTALVKADVKPVTTTIKATLVGLDGQDTDISKTCEVNITPTYSYDFNLETNPYAKFFIEDYSILTATIKVKDAENLDPNMRVQLIKDKNINFKIKSGDGGLSPVNGIETPDNTQLSVSTDPNGQCQVKLTGNKKDTIAVEAIFQPHPNDPNTISLTSVLDVGDYEVSSPHPSSYTVTSPNAEVTLTSYLYKSYSMYPSDRASGKEIKFIREPNSTTTGTFIPGDSAVTDLNGAATIKLTSFSKKMGGVIVSTKFQSDSKTYTGGSTIIYVRPSQQFAVLSTIGDGKFPLKVGQPVEVELGYWSPPEISVEGRTVYCEVRYGDVSVSPTNPILDGNGRCTVTLTAHAAGGINILFSMHRDFDDQTSGGVIFFTSAYVYTGKSSIPKIDKDNINKYFHTISF